MKPNRLYMYRGYLIFCGEYRIYFIECGEKLSIFGVFLEWPFYTTKIVFPITLYLIWLRTKLIVRSVQIPAVLRRSPKRLVCCNFKIYMYYSKTCRKRPLIKKTKIGFQDQLSLNAGQKYCRMLQGGHSAIL